MTPVYAGEKVLKDVTSIFLVGPTPRSSDVESWRPTALLYLEEFDGIVYVPEMRSADQTRLDYTFNAEWEHEALNASTVIVAWVPRDLETMPAFTTNVEFGYFVSSGKLIYGRPDDAPNCKYLDWLYEKETGKKPLWNMIDLMYAAIYKAKQSIVVE